MFRLTSSLLCGLFVLGAACGGSQTSSEKLEVDLEESDSESETEISVQVISHAFRDATIYLHIGDSRHRLGIAYGKQTTVFTLPWSNFERASGLRLYANPIGEQANVGSDSFTVKPGNMVVWTLEAQLGKFDGAEAPGQSNVTVY